MVVKVTLKKKLGELRLKAACKKVLDTSVTVVFSGGTGKCTLHSEGVAVMLSIEADKALIK